MIVNGFSIQIVMSMITNMDVKLEDIVKEYADENTHVHHTGRL